MTDMKEFHLYVSHNCHCTPGCITKGMAWLWISVIEKTTDLSSQYVKYGNYNNVVNIKKGQLC